MTGTPSPTGSTSSGRRRTMTQASRQRFRSATRSNRAGALILALGTYEPPAGEATLTATLLDLYVNDPDAGVHAAAEWTLRRWKQEAALTAANARQRGTAPGTRRWYVDGQGLTFSIIARPGEFVMGSRADEPWKRAHETAHRRVVPRGYAIASKEVSIAQFEEFLKSDPKRQQSFAHERARGKPDYPRNDLSWFDAAAFCNWLSLKEGLPTCYVPNGAGVYGPGMSIKANALDLAGYRLPTEAEWEYAARAGTLTSRSHGNSDRLLPRYAWTAGSSGGRSHPCGLLLPNDFGLFDMLGNLTEWTQNEAQEYPAPAKAPAVDLLDGATVIDTNRSRVLRGGTFIDREDDARVMRRDRAPPADWYPTYGLRPVRTIR